MQNNNRIQIDGLKDELDSKESEIEELKCKERQQIMKLNMLSQKLVHLNTILIQKESSIKQYEDIQFKLKAELNEKLESVMKLEHDFEMVNEKLKVMSKELSNKDRTIEQMKQQIAQKDQDIDALLYNVKRFTQIIKVENYHANEGFGDEPYDSLRLEDSKIESHYVETDEVLYKHETPVNNSKTNKIVSTQANQIGR